MPKYNKRKLSIIYDKRQKDFVVKYPRNCDGSLAFYYLIGDILRFDIMKYNTNEIPYEIINFKKDLEERGYDLTTFKFSIELKN